MALKKVKPAAEVVNDVAPPNTSEPDSSSKSILITHRPVVKDPMMVADNAATTTDVVETKPELKTPSQTRKVIAPSAQEAAEVNAITEADKPAAKVERSADNDALSVDGLPTNDDKKKDSKLQAEHQASVEKLVENKTYYLPINQVEKRRNKRYTLLGIVFIIVLGAAWLDVSLDAGIITIPGVEAPTHFFR